MKSLWNILKRGIDTVKQPATRRESRPTKKTKTGSASKMEDSPPMEEQEEGLEEEAETESPPRGRYVTHPHGSPAYKVFDKKVFENICRIQCTVDEIEYILGSKQNIIDGWCLREYKETFREVRERLRMGGKASLRRIQFKLAERNAGMAIFLGKNILGQTDHMVQTIETKQEVIHKRVLQLPDNGRRKANVEPKSKPDTSKDNRDSD